MDAIIASLTQAAPVGVGGLLLVLFALLLKRESEASRRHSEEMTRVQKSHDDELAELRAEIKSLRQQVDELQKRLDDERELRRAAEDSARTQRMHPRRQSPWPA